MNLKQISVYVDSDILGELELLCDGDVSWNGTSYDCDEVTKVTLTHRTTGEAIDLTDYVNSTGMEKTISTGMEKTIEVICDNLIDAAISHNDSLEAQREDHEEARREVAQ